MCHPVSVQPTKKKQLTDVLIIWFHSFQVLITQEDCDVATWFGKQDDYFDVPKPKDNDEVVERIRRMHLNDLENFTPFFFLGLAYAMSKVCQFSIGIVN